MPEIDFNKVLKNSTGKQFDPISPWYVYAATCIEGVGPPTCPAIRDIWIYIASQTDDEATLLKVARRIREGLLKGSVLVGFPRGINALSVLHKTIQDHNPSIAAILETDKSLRSALSAEQLSKRGQDFFSAVYERHTQKVQSNMAKTSGGDLDQFAILSVYGELMSETSLVSAKETGLLEFLACYAMGAAPQANGHMYGSRNLGNSKEDIQTGIKLVKAVVKALGVQVDFEAVDEVAKKMERW